MYDNEKYGFVRAAYADCSAEYAAADYPLVAFDDIRELASS